MAGKNEYTVFDYLQWRGDLTLQQDPFNEVDNLVLCIIAYINLRKIDRLWSKNPKDAMPIGDVCARLTAADEQLGLSSLDYIPVMRAAAETERRITAICCDNLQRYPGGWPLRNQVDFSSGYRKR